MVKLYKGQQFKTNNYGTLEVVEYKNCKEVVVIFLSTGYKTTARSQHIKKGCVKDVFSPSVQGVGYLGGNNLITNHKNPAYVAWTHMLERCYSADYQLTRPTYIGCTVCDGWHNFNTFSTWFNEYYFDGAVLDKDIIVDGNKIYSPENCKLVTLADNNIKARAKNHIFIDPEGIKTAVYNLTQFCKGKGLTRSNMEKVISGKQNHHKGWTV